MIVPSRARLAAAAIAALISAAAIGTAAPVQALTFDNEPVRSTFHFTVAGHAYTLRDVSLGTATQTVHVGQHSGQVHSHYRLTLKDDHGHVLAKVKRSLYKQSYLVTAFSDRAFTSVAAFHKAEHRALTVTEAVAKRAYLKGLRIESVSADLESNVSATLDYLDALPAGATPDFTKVAAVHSNEYRGDVTISGTDAKTWSVIVRDRQDGYGEFYDDATGGASQFRF